MDGEHRLHLSHKLLFTNAGDPNRLGKTEQILPPGISGGGWM